ncbi:MAG: J domain-containing protein [Deltaproteobacteria bacterium]|nr:J domain-containing protein [Deltaproteobacteria bacterium]
MERKDYYIILGVPNTESEIGIRRAFRELAKSYHPDRVGPRGTRNFQEIIEAYSVLSDPEKRREYNASLCAAEKNIKIDVRPVETQEKGKPEALIPESISVTRGFETISPSRGELFDRIVRNFSGIRIPKGEGIQKLNVEVILSPDEARRGGAVPIGVPVFHTCRFCGGSGHDWVFPCIHCQEQGVVEDEEVVTIRIPPMVPDGTVFEVPLRGLGIRDFQLRVHIRIDTQ